MKLIIAYIQSEKYDDVRQTLAAGKIRRVLRGGPLAAARQKVGEAYRGVDVEEDLVKRVKLQVVVRDSAVNPTISAIIRAVKALNAGDGGVYVLPAEHTRPRIA